MASKKHLEELIDFTEKEFCKICEKEGWSKEEVFFMVMSGVVTGSINIWELMTQVDGGPRYEIRHTQKLREEENATGL